MSEFVLMRHPHPELSDCDPVLVHASAFQGHALSGWVAVTDSPEVKASDDPKPTSGANTSKEDKK